MMAVALIGESLLYAVIEVLVDRIASSEVKNFFKRQITLKNIVLTQKYFLNDIFFKNILK